VGVDGIAFIGLQAWFNHIANNPLDFQSIGKVTGRLYTLTDNHQKIGNVPIGIIQITYAYLLYLHQNGIVSDMPWKVNHDFLMGANMIIGQCNEWTPKQHEYLLANVFTVYNWDVIGRAWKHDQDEELSP
jgi:hypothetical protein